jgi:hypothetical protein
VSDESTGLVPIGGALATTGGKSLTEIKEGLLARREMIKAIREEVMIVDVHYGRIPGTPKDSLYKSGAEILAQVFNLTVRLEVVEKLVEEDEATYRTGATVMNSSGDTILYVERVCSTKEKKYRWREAQSDEEYKATSRDRRQIIQKRDDKGKTYELKQVRQDVGSVENTILGMSSKRSYVAGVAMATGASEQFTLNESEMEKAEAANEKRKQGRKKPKPVATAESQAAEPKKEGEAPTAPAAAPKKAAEGVAPDNPPDAFVVNEIKILKKGKKKDDTPYTLWAIVAGGLTWITFSDTFAAIAQECKDQGVRIFLQGDKNTHGDFDLLECKKTELAA